MARTRTIFLRAVQSFLKLKNSLRRWIILLLISAFIFSGCLITSRVNAQVPIVKQNQQKLSRSGLVDRGREYYKNKQYNKAIETWQQALKIYQNNQNKKDTLHQAMVWSYISLGYQKQSNWNQAKEAIDKSLDLFPEKKKLDKSKEKLQINAQILNTHASLQLAFGESQKALKTWKKATQIYQQLGDEIGVTGSLINQAQAMEALGLYKRSCTTLLGVFDFENEKCQISDSQLEKALFLVKNSGNTKLISALRSLGDNLRLVNELEDSEKLLKGILGIAYNNRNLIEIEIEIASAMRLSLGNTERALYRSNQDLYDRSDNNNYRDKALYKAQDSLKYYDTIIKDAQTEPLPSKIIAQAKLNRFNLLLEFKEWLQKVPKVNPEVRKEYIKVKERIKDDIPQLVNELESEKSSLSRLTPIEEIYTTINLSRNLIRLQGEKFDKDSDNEYIKNILMKANEKAENLKSKRAESYAKGSIGYFYENTNMLNEAKMYTDNALRIAQSIQAWDIAYQLQEQLGKIYEAKGTKKEAIKAYEAAVKTIDIIRKDLASNSSETLLYFRSTVEPLYEKLIDLYLEQPKENQNFNKIIDVNERFQLSELENYLNCDLNDSTKIEDSAKKNKNPIAIIYMMVLEKQNKLVVVAKSFKNQKISPPIVKDWEKCISKKVSNIQEKLFRNSVIQKKDIDDILTNTKELYKSLISPIKDYLPQTDTENKGTLVFVLDSQLQNIPMSLLLDENNCYLMQDYNITVALGSQIKEPKPLTWKKSRALLAGVSEEKAGFKKLKNVPCELEIVASKTVGDKELLNKSFTKENFENQVKSFSYPIIHLATHGNFSSDPEETFILTYDDNENLKLEDFENLFKSRSQNRSDTIELLVLSACQTAKGDKRAGLGIAGIAVQAGARSTVAGLWNVSDSSAPFFMKHFYEALKNGKTKAEALRDAQIACLNNKKYKSPYYWAGFILVGSWL